MKNLIMLKDPFSCWKYLCQTSQLESCYQGGLLRGSEASFRGARYSPCLLILCYCLKDGFSRWENAIAIITFVF